MNLPLNIRIADVFVEFDRPTPVRMLATTTFRGMLGHVLAEHYPELVSKIFKPGFASDIPAPYALAPEKNPKSPSNYFKFKLITFDPDGFTIETFDNLIHFCEGKHFGTSGSIIESCEMEPGTWFENTISEYIPKQISVNFVTPTSFKYKGKKVLPNIFSLPILIAAIYNTFKKLCKHYAYDNTFSFPHHEEILGHGYIIQNNLKWVSPRRYSSSQETTLNLSGLVGNIIIKNPKSEAPVPAL